MRLVLRDIEPANAHREVDRVQILQCGRKRGEVYQQVNEDDRPRKGEDAARDGCRPRRFVVQSRNDVDQTGRSRSPSFRLPSR